MEKLIRFMAKKVDTDEAVGYLVRVALKMLLVIIRLCLVRERQRNLPRPTSFMLDYLASYFTPSLKVTLSRRNCCRKYLTALLESSTGH